MKRYTDQDIAEAKAKFPNVVRELAVYPSETEFDKEGKASEEPVWFLIRKPSKSLVEMLGSKEFKGEDNQDKANAAIVSNCVLAGDMERMENDASIFTGLLEKLAQLVTSSRVELKKV